jgi:hypothetical protein
MRTEEDRERARRAERYRRIATRQQPAVRLCVRCSRPAVSSSHWYCAGCRALVQPRPRGTTTGRGYDASHVRDRKKWALLVDAGGIACGRCGRPIIPGTFWDLSHPFDEKSMAPEPWHRKCNRSYAATITKARRRKSQ